MRLLPTKRQWKNWSLPSKLTAIGAYAGILALVLTVVLQLLLKGDSTRKVLEELVAVPFDEYVSLDNRLKELAEERGKTPKQLKLF